MDRKDSTYNSLCWHNLHLTDKHSKIEGRGALVLLLLVGLESIILLHRLLHLLLLVGHERVGVLRHLPSHKLLLLLLLHLHLGGEILLLHGSGHHVLHHILVLVLLVHLGCLLLCLMR